MYRFFSYIYSIQKTKKIAVAGLFLVFLVVCGILGSKLQFEEDITKLIPSGKKASTTTKVLNHISFTDKIVVNIQSEDSASSEALISYASHLLDSLRQLPSGFVKTIQGKIDDSEMQEIMHFVGANIPLFLDKKDYVKLDSLLRKTEIEKRTLSNYKTLISPIGLAVRENILSDPLGITFLGLKKLKQLNSNNNFVLKDGFLVSENNKNLLLFLTPGTSANDNSVNTELSNRLYQIKAGLDAKFNNKIVAEYFGAPLVGVANASRIKTDIQLTVGIALSVLVVFLILFYRNISVPLILFLPALFGAIVALALLYLLRQKVSLISLGIGSVILGITIDYSLHILTHYRKYKNVELLYKDITRPILMSSFTTSVAFLSLMFLDSRALQDLGLFASFSVLSASFFALLLIPQLYKTQFSSREYSNGLIDRMVTTKKGSKFFIPLLLIALLISCFTFKDVIFNQDISKLNYLSPTLKTAENNLKNITDTGLKSIYLVTYADTSDTAIQNNSNIGKKLAELKNQGVISSYRSIDNLLRSEVGQKEKIAEWDSFWTNQKKEQLRANIIESGKRLGFKPDAFKSFYNSLDRPYQTVSLDKYSSLKFLPVDEFLNSDLEFTTIVSTIKLENRNIDRFTTALSDMPSVIIVDRQHMNEVFLEGLKKDFNKLIGYSFVGVVLLLLFFFRSVLLTLITTIPIALTWLLTLGMMALLKIEFNVFNIIISTFIFGLGIDYCIFISSGLLKEYQYGEEKLSTYKISILLSVFTTLLGVGVLIFAKHPALISVSRVSIIGILSAVVISFLLQPLLFKLLIGNNYTGRKKPVSPILLLFSTISFAYYGIGGLILSLFSLTFQKWLPLRKESKTIFFHTVISKFMASVFYSYPFISVKIRNRTINTFNTPSVIIANHTSFLDILAMGMLHPKIIFLVNDWVYNSPVFGKVVKTAGFYKVSNGLDEGLDILQEKVNQGFSLMVFPEGTRSKTHKIRRFHKGAFYLAEKLNLDILPILIHGNDKILPKGSFIIQRGTITIKLLEKIAPSNLSYGNTYSHRAKQIGEYFRTKFKELRNELENENYYVETILSAYKFKGDNIYKQIKNKIKYNTFIYQKIAPYLPMKAKIIHYSTDYGQLDFLINLYSVEREIKSFIEHDENRKIANSCYLLKERNISFVPSYNNLFKEGAEIVILTESLEAGRRELLIDFVKDKSATIITIKDKTETSFDAFSVEFKAVFRDEDVVIYKN